MAVPGVTVEARGPMTASAVTDCARRVPHRQPRARQLRRDREAGGIRDHDDPGDDLGTERNPPRARDTAGALPESAAWRERRLPSTCPAARQTMNEFAALSTHAPAPLPGIDGRQPRRRGFNTESYDHIDENGFKHVSTDPLSTFSVDVDTASYANVRRFLREGRLPYPGAVRVEELINYFRLPYAEPDGPEPFSITTELSECPWNPAHRLALIGIQGRAVSRQRAGAAQSRLPHRRLGLDDAGRQAAARAVGHADAGGRARRPRSRGDRGLRRRQRPGAAVDPRHRQGDDRARHRRPAPGRIHQRRGRHPARLPHRPRALHPRRRQPRRAGHRRRLQRGRHQPGRAGTAHRAGARVGGVPVGARRRHRQPEGLDDGEARRQGQRQLRLPRLAARGPQGAGARARRHARHHRQGREDPGGVQSAGRSTATA